MGTLQQDQFPLGWTPNSNESNGDRRGLLRADNLVFNEEGIVSLSRGCRSVGTAASEANGLYSKTLLGGNILRYVSYAGNVARNTPSSDPTTFGTGVIIGGAGDAAHTAFGSAWGHTIVLSGTQKKLDDGTTIQDLDLGTPPAVTATVNAPPTSVSPTDTLDGQWVDGGEGVITSSPGNYVKIEVDTATFRGVAHNYELGGGGTTVFDWDTTDFGSGTGKEMPNDLFSMDVRFEPEKLEKIRVELIFDPRPPVDEDADTPDPSDYFFHEWYADTILDTNPTYFDPNIFHYEDSEAFIEKVRNNLEPGISFVNYYKEGQNFWGTIQALRSQFKRVGSDDSKHWNSIQCIRVTFKMTESPADCFFWKMNFQGSSAGQLNGFYQYLQVNCFNSGNFIQRSVAGTPSSEYQVIKANTTVTPQASGGNCNRLEIYRSSTQTPGYFLVKVIEPKSTTPFTDDLSDIDALRDNIPLDYYRTVVPDDIQFIVGPTYQRMLYFDLKTMYPGIRYDPGSYDARHSATICSAAGETILWVRTVIDGVIMVGTSHDIYQIRGDFSYEETLGILNYSIEALGIEQVPVSSAVTEYGTQIIYLAEDGWRSISGSTTYSMVDSIGNLYRGFESHGIPAVGIGSNNLHVHSACISKGRLICSVNQSDDTRALHIFDLEKKRWSYWKGDSIVRPMFLLAEEDGTVIFTVSGSGWVFEFDYGYSLGASTQTFLMRTTYSDNDQPRHRKDPLVLTIDADTGGANVNILLRCSYNDGSILTKTIVTSFSELQTKLFSLDPALGTDLGSPKAFQLEISYNATISTFKFNGYAVAYVDHPEEMNYIIIPPDNLGVAGRKRMPAIPFLIDTQGNSVICTPYVDGTAQTTSTLISTGKKLLHHYFTSDVTGYVLGIKLASAATNSPFELYDILPHREVERLPDPVKYKAMPVFNFGTTKRKRLIQFAFEIDTKSSNVTFTPQWTVEGTWTFGTPQVYNTVSRQTVLYLFASSTIAIDVAGVLSGSNEFEYYGLVQESMVSEALPPATKYLHIPATNFGTTKRKRLIQYGFTIDTKGHTVTFTPYVDGVALASQTFATSYKDTVIYFFADNVIGIDVYATVTCESEFECYGPDLEACYSEVLPAATKWLHIPATNLGTTKRKRFIQYGLVIDTKGQPVIFTAYVDGVAAGSTTFTTTYKDTVIHFFVPDTIGIDVYGILDGTSEFEFYGPALDQTTSEALPAATKELHITLDNLGTPNKKRIRTIPFQIDTHGGDVTFTPTLDGVEYPPSTHNTSGKRTVFHYFTTDVFPVDVMGDLEGDSEFEFYGITGAVIVETLPVGRLYDQVGPMEFNRQTRVYGFRLQVITESTTLNYQLFSEDVSLLTGVLTTSVNLDQTKEVNFVKGVNMTVFRFEMSSELPFYRLKFQIKVGVTGSDTDSKWVNL